MLPMMFDWINKTINESDTIVKVGASKICHESNHMKILFNQKYKWSYLDVTNDVWYHWQNNKTYDLQYTNSNNNNR